MKRYWLFQCNEYDANGGLNDLKHIGDDIDELKSKAPLLDFAWIVDTEKWYRIAIGGKIWLTNKYDWIHDEAPIEILQEEK